MAVPTVTVVAPTYGTAAGGTSVVITGTALTAATAVKFGTTNATSYVVDGATQITAVAAAHIPGIVDVTVTTAEGTSATSSADEYEYVGLFSLAEARAFNNAKLANVVNYPTADIIAAELRIREAFQDITNCYFYPVSTTVYLDGDGTSSVFIDDYVNITAVTALVVYCSDQSVDETFDAGDLTDLGIEPWGLITRRSHGNFLRGVRNIAVTFTHGYTTVPGDIKRAALMVLLNEMTFTSVGDRTTSYSDGVMTYQLATAGRTNQWFGLPLVDSVLQRYRRSLPGVG